MKRVTFKRLSLLLVLSLLTSIFMMVSCSDEQAETSNPENAPVEAPEKPKVEPNAENSLVSPNEFTEVATPGEIVEPEEIPEEDLPDYISTPNELEEPKAE